MTTIKQAFNSFSELIKSNGEKLCQIKTMISELIKTIPINNTSIIKLFNTEVSKVYYLNDCCNGIQICNIITVTKYDTIHTQCKLNEVSELICNDIFIHDMRFMGYDYLYGMHKKDLISNVETPKTFNDVYESFITNILADRFEFNESKINPRVFLTCAIASRLAYEDNIVPRYELKLSN